MGANHALQAQHGRTRAQLGLNTGCMFTIWPYFKPFNATSDAQQIHVNIQGARVCVCTYVRMRFYVFHFLHSYNIIILLSKTYATPLFHLLCFPCHLKTIAFCKIPAFG